MTELEKEQKIKLIIQEFKKEAEKLEESENKNEKHTTLDNGRTRYTELYEKYKKKMEEIK